MTMLTVQGAVILGLCGLFRSFDPFAARVAGWLGVVWLVLVIACLAQECYLKAGICAWHLRWNRRQEREARRLAIEHLKGESSGPQGG